MVVGFANRGRGLCIPCRCSARDTLDASTKDLVEIENMELQYFYDNYTTIGTMGSIIAGFAFSVIVTDEGVLSGEWGHNNFVNALCVVARQIVSRVSASCSRAVVFLRVTV